MHGSKRFIVIGDAYEYGRWHDRLDPPPSGREGRHRLKRSRHRTSVDTFLVRETEIKWVGRRFGRAPAPKRWRKVLTRRYRARMRDLLRHARYDDCYPPPRDGA